MTRAPGLGDWRASTWQGDPVDPSGLRSLAEVLSGPYAITFAGWLLLAPLSIAVMGIAAAHDGADVTAIVASALPGQLLMGAILLAVRSGLEFARPGPRVRLMTAVAAFAACGLIRNGVPLAATGNIGPERAAQVVNALQTGVLVAVIGLTLAALVVSQWERYAGRSRDLATELGRLDGLRSGAAASLTDVDRTIEATVSIPLRRTLAAAELGLAAARPDSLSSDADQAIHLNVLALDLRRMAADVVRPLSHDLAVAATPVAAASESQPRSPIARVTAFAGATFTVAPFQPAITVLLAAPLVAVVVLQELHEPWVGVGGAFDIVVGLALSLAARRWLAAPIRSWPLSPRVVTVTAVWVLQAASWLVFSWPFLHEARMWPGVFAGALSLPVLSLVAAAGAAFADGRRSVEARLAAANAQLAAETAQFRREAAERRLALAQVLHGHILGTLTAAAVLVGSAAEDGDAETVQAAQDAVAQARSALDDLTRPAEIGADLEVVIGEHRRLWLGLLELDVEVAPEVQASAHDPALVGAIDRLVGECLSGMVRYGHARHARVRADTQTRPGVLLTVDSDGIPVHEQVWPENGSALFEQLAMSWTLQPLPDGGTRIRLELAPGRRHRPDHST